jgi:hypothetical protein
MKCAPGWWWRFPLMCALVYGFFVTLMPVGWALGHVSDAVGAVFGGRR